MTVAVSLIFDLDGTLVESAAAIRLALNKSLKPLGFGPLSLEVTRGFIGYGVPHLLDCVAKHIGVSTDSPVFKTLSADFNAIYEVQTEGNEIISGVPEALTTLKARGFRLGLCTNKPMVPTRSVLQHLALNDLFDFVIAGDSLATRKPDPAMLLAAKDALGAESCLYIGDSEVDARTAHAASIPFLLYTKGYRKASAEALEPWKVFDDYADLPELAQSFGARNSQA